MFRPVHEYIKEILGGDLGIKKFNIWRYSELFCTGFEDERGLNGRDDMR